MSARAICSRTALLGSSHCAIVEVVVNTVALGLRSGWRLGDEAEPVDCCSGGTLLAGRCIEFWVLLSLEQTLAWWLPPHLGHLLTEQHPLLMWSLRHEKHQPFKICLRELIEVTTPQPYSMSEPAGCTVLLSKRGHFLKLCIHTYFDQ